LAYDLTEQGVVPERLLLMESDNRSSEVVSDIPNYENSQDNEHALLGLS